MRGQGRSSRTSRTSRSPRRTRHTRSRRPERPGRAGRPGRRPGPPGTSACGNDIDSVLPNGAEEFSVFLVDGVTYGGHRHNATSGAYIRQDLTTTQNPGYPNASTVCSATLSAQGPNANFKVQTTVGTVYELQCNANAPMGNLDCGPLADGTLRRWNQINFTVDTGGPFVAKKTPAKPGTPSMAKPQKTPSKSSARP